jgi:hypothetical protein
MPQTPDTFKVSVFACAAAPNVNEKKRIRKESVFMIIFFDLDNSKKAFRKNG